MLPKINRRTVKDRLGDYPPLERSVEEQETQGSRSHAKQHVQGS